MKIKRISNMENTYGTSSCGLYFDATTEQIIAKVGEPDYREEPYGKTTREWDLELEDGTPFTIYDWKEYREYDDDEVINWHIGTQWADKEAADKVKQALTEVGLYK